MYHEFQFFADFDVVVVAEWSKASDHFRSFGEKLKWDPGDNFVSKTNVFRAVLVFTPFFKPYVSFLLI